MATSQDKGLSGYRSDWDTEFALDRWCLDTSKAKSPGYMDIYPVPNVDLQAGCDGPNSRGVKHDMSNQFMFKSKELEGTFCSVNWHSYINDK